jgi:hypothetical protein
MDVANMAASDGWHAWRVERLDGKTVDDLRRDLALSARASS